MAPFLLLSPLRAVAFIVVTQALFGFYLGVSFLTNHVGMPTLVGTDELGFLRRQVLTSRNLSGPSLTGFLFGGLDTQIEHHLFPTMPRANLRRARRPGPPVLRRTPDRVCRAEPWRAYREVLVHLRRAGHRSDRSRSSTERIRPTETSPGMVAEAVAEAAPRGSRSKSGAGPQP